ncbi:hypothetical protein IHE45_06G053500 [Dioscorea alata]|uniref:Uncharacterized protein n=1 Tax=Dioscorea alata TaxID=55571 RepID=A0ACB7VWZ4_DIOAL|nr:hypothetical protein IHE45_06G053500 [Dioscorea alata]
MCVISFYLTWYQRGFSKPKIKIFFFTPFFVPAHRRRRRLAPRAPRPENPAPRLAPRAAPRPVPRAAAPRAPCPAPRAPCRAQPRLAPRAPRPVPRAAAPHAPRPAPRAARSRASRPASRAARSRASRRAQRAPRSPCRLAPRAACASRPVQPAPHLLGSTASISFFVPVFYGFCPSLLSPEGGRHA